MNLEKHTRCKKPDTKGYCMILFTLNVPNGKSTEIGSSLLVAKGIGTGELLTDMGFLFWDDGNIMELGSAGSCIT